MAHLQIKNVPPELHGKVRRRAVEEGLTMSALIIKILEEEVSHPSWREWLDELHRDEPVDTGNSVVAAIHAGREERDQELAAAHYRS